MTRYPIIWASVVASGWSMAARARAAPSAVSPLRNTAVAITARASAWSGAVPDHRARTRWASSATSVRAPVGP